MVVPPEPATAKKLAIESKSKEDTRECNQGPQGGKDCDPSRVIRERDVRHHARCADNGEGRRY